VSGFGSLALPAFLPSVISSFLLKIRGGRAPQGPPLDSPLEGALYLFSNTTNAVVTETEALVSQSVEIPSVMKTYYYYCIPILAIS